MSNTEALISLVESLRDSDELVDELYVDGEVPPNPADRTRIYPGDPARENQFPVEIAVRVNFSGSATNRGIVTRGYVIECTVVAEEDWYRRYQSLQLLSIFDAVDKVGVLAPEENYVSEGTTGGSAGISIDSDTGRRSVSSQWQFRHTSNRY